MALWRWCLTRIGLGAAVTIMLAAFLTNFPQYSQHHDQAMLRLYRQLFRSPSSPFSPSASAAHSISVVSFNIRYDGVERLETNHYRQRVTRLADFLTRVEPSLVGLQEAFSGQLLHLQSLLPAHARVVGYAREGDRADPRRMRDFQTGIIYDSRQLELIESDHVWLSLTPRREGSRSWGSKGARTLTMAAFRFLNRDEDDADCDDKCPADVLLLNTHLDVWNARARIEQARAARSWAQAWAKRHPSAVLFHTGDFNAINGQSPHRVMLQREAEGGHWHLRDAWQVCASSPLCHSRVFACTFHAWLGAVVNSYGARMAQALLWIAHGTGVELPRREPSSFREGARMLKSVLAGLWKAQGVADITLWSEWPESLSRMHVDWVLFAQPLRSFSAFDRCDTTDFETQSRSTGVEPCGSSSVELRCKVVAVFVSEVRDMNFSSDHFPVIGLFELQLKASRA